MKKKKKKTAKVAMMNKTLLATLFATSCLSMLASNTARSEELYEPSLPESTMPERLLEVLPEPDTATGSDKVVLNALKGLVFHGSPDTLLTDGWQGEVGVVMDRVDIPGDQQALLAELKPYLGQPLTFAGLNDIRRLMENWFSQHDLPVIQVIAPPGQDITSGVVQYVVVTGRLGDIRVEGAKYNDPGRLVRSLGLSSGELLSSKVLNDNLGWLNRDPFREVSALLAAGAEFGQTDIILNVEDRPPRRFYTRYENSGTPTTDLDRWIAGFNLGNLWQRDHLFSYQYTRAFHSKYLQAHAFDYQAPLSWRHIVDFSGAYAESKPEGLNSFNQQGRSWRLGGNYTIPLSGSDRLRRHELKLGYVFKRGNSDLEFGGVNVFSSDTDVSQFEIGYLLGILDPYGLTEINLRAVVSPGGMTRYNDDHDYQQARANASADYQYARLSLKRQTPLPMDLVWQAELNVQGTGDSLLPTEQMAAGGYSTVRGYDQFAVLGDQGLILRNELRSPARSLLAEQSGLQDQVQLLAFYDYATLGNNNRLAGERATNLASAGLGLRYSLDRYLTVRLDYGWQLLEVSPGVGRGEQLHAAIELSY
ncbi:ShlB/FhaC/HecB family hemolysin secretion/activation protein [Endozoicomonas lisbonensis]|uniref:Hemolysin activation/secretion protein n=2 Tax=Endozoicomonas lisbonensis TaxID=3120522 RepID=A0ABV2SC61_9GAMM